MDYPATPIRRRAEHTVRHLASLAILAAAATACGPATPAASVSSAVAPGAAGDVNTGPTLPAAATPSTPSDASAAPDDAGYMISPARVEALRLSAGYVPMDIGPAGPFLVDLQAHLSERDTAWLTEAVHAGPSALSVGGLEGEHAAADVAAPDLAAALDALLDEGSHPIVQGYFASIGDDPVAVDRQGASDGAAIDTLDVVTTGWRGDAPSFVGGRAGSPAARAPQTAVWRFTRDARALSGADAAVWSWRSWRWSADGGYFATVAALEQTLDGPDHDRYPYFHVVRPRDRWPTPFAEATHDVPSPDGRWIAREIDGGGAQVEARDERSILDYRAVEIVDRNGQVVARPLAVWQYEDMGFARPAAFAWRPGHDQVVLGWAGNGDGCDLHGGARLFLCDAPSGALTPLAVGGPQAKFDPSGRYLASVGIYRPGSVDAAGNVRSERGTVAVLDVDADTTISATIAAEEIAEPVVWAPDGSALVFTVVDDYAECAQYNASHLIRFDLQAGQLTATALTTSAPGLRRATAWRDDGTLDVDVFDAGAAWDTKVARTERRDAATGALISP